jgi:hypothetical protein
VGVEVVHPEPKKLGVLDSLLAPLPQLLPRLNELLNRPRCRKSLVVQAALPMRFAVKVLYVRHAQQGQPPLQFFQVVLCERFIFGEVWPASHGDAILPDSPFVRRLEPSLGFIAMACVPVVVLTGILHHVSNKHQPAAAFLNKIHSQ